MSKTAASKRWLDHVLLADCRDALPALPDESVDLVMTSPPYADRRRKQYGGVPADKYVEWFLPISAELRRVLKPTGSFVLNIKEHVVNCERSTYVMELILAMRRQQKWLFTEEYMWRKTNPMIGRWPNRLKDGWERCLHFTKRRRFKMRQDAVRIPAKESTKRRLERQRRRGKSDAYVSPTGSGFQYKWSRLDRDTVLPDNVITLPRITHSVGHPAAFPVELPAWFIRLFTDEGDTVLDPFCGSGTTCVAALRGRRRFVGIEINAVYHAKAQRRVSEEPS